MLVRLIGFTFTVEGKGELSLSAFAQSLASLKVDIENNEDRRLLFINDKHDEDYYVGLVVTVKDHRTFCELVSADDSLLVKVNKLDRDSNLMDFNFFVVNKATGAGLYQHYHQSCSVSAFASMTAKRFREYRKTKLDKAMESSKEISASQRRKITTSCSNNLHWEIIVRQEALSAMIAEMKRVKSFEYALATPVVEEQEFSPLKPFVKRKSERIVLSVGTPVQAAAKAVSAFVASTPLTKGRIEGIDEDGITRILSIVDNPDNFGEFDYDELAPKLNEMNLTKFEKSWIVTELIKRCKANKAIFEYEES